MALILFAALTAETAPIEPDVTSDTAKQSSMNVAQLDATRFKLDSSVTKWSGWSDRYAKLVSDGSGQDFSTLMRDVIVGSASKDLQSASYWGYHSARLSFFIGSAVAGLVAHDLTDSLSVKSAASVERAASKTADSSSILSRFAGTAPRELVSRVSECVGTWQQDKEAIDEGVYRLPWDMVTLSNRQYNPIWSLLKVAQFLPEAAATLQRRVAEKPEEVWLSGTMYPQYYSKSFHYQSDGWLSSQSASVY